jgi:uncharacterized protein
LISTRLSGLIRAITQAKPPKQRHQSQPVMIRSLSFFSVLLAALVLLAAPLAAQQAPVRFGPPQPLEIATAAGVLTFAIELAETTEQRQHGLMFRKELLAGTGMLFDFKADQEIGMWMMNTYIPLDMLFIKADGRIHRIAENTEPHSTRTIPSMGPVRAVLELPGGTVRKLGIKAGDLVGHPMFKPR